MKTILKNAVKEAQKARDKTTTETIRSILAAIQYEEMEKKVDELAHDACVVVLQREVKKRKESLDFAKQAGRLELVAQSEAEIMLLESFLPKQLSSTELEAALMQIKQESPDSNMGLAIKSMRDKFPGQVDGKLASELARKIFG